jgi:hypothetical protein
MSIARAKTPDAHDDYDYRLRLAAPEGVTAESFRTSVDIALHTIGQDEGISFFEPTSHQDNEIGTYCELYVQSTDPLTTSQAYF